MEKKILEFARILRKSGVNISFTQIADALNAVAEVGFSYENFYNALQCTLIKEQSEQFLFDKLFRLYFFSLHEGSYLDLQSQKETDRLTAIIENDLEPMRELVKNADGKNLGRGGGSSPLLLLIKAVQNENYTLLSFLAELAVKSLGTISRDALNEIDKMILQAKISISWYEAVNRLEIIKKQKKISDFKYYRWMQCLAYLEKKIEELLEDFFIKNYGLNALEEIATDINLKEKEFCRLNHFEVEEIRSRITKLARKLASKCARRYHRAKHGKVDFRRTVMHAQRTSGTPIYLKYRKKIITKPDLVILCDVSGSVAVFSEFMLQLVYLIQNRFRSVRSFLFVDDIEEVTNHFLNINIEEALQKVFSQTCVSHTGYSDFGKVFSKFANKYLSELTKKTTLIILGDAKNNWRPHEKESLQKISEHVRKVLWFNPQPQNTWDTDDSIMSIYAPYCHQVFECRNLKQLESIIEAIF